MTSRNRNRAITITLAFLIVYAGVAYRSPYGFQDAFATWNATARLITYNDPMVVFQQSGLSHRDYPPLLPLALSLGLRLFGDSVLIPIVLHGAVYAAILWLLRKIAWVQVFAGVVLLPYAASQYADLPLALAFLGAAVAYRANKPLWVGFALGIGVLVKNEGILIALAFYAVWIAWERRICWQALLITLPFAACLVLWHSIIRVPNDVVGSTGILQRVSDVSRYPVIAKLTWQGLLDFGGLALPVFAGVVWLRGERLRVDVPLIAGALVLVGYVAVYVITPYDVAWHIGSSWDRLILHVFPVVMYSVFRGNAV